MTKVDPLMQALQGCESRLRAWLNECDLNAELFRRDPLTAIRAANLGIDEGLLAELEGALTGIALKLGLASEVRTSGT
jgi:predicted component of type VI protein secretion system